MLHIMNICFGFTFSFSITNNSITYKEQMFKQIDMILSYTGIYFCNIMSVSEGRFEIC